MKQTWHSLAFWFPKANGHGMLAIMKLSLTWLQDFIEFSETDPAKLNDIITAHIAEVDEVEVQGALLNKCVVGKVVALSKHPNADKLTLCDVQTDDGVKKVVCGGDNLREGMRVAMAHVGAQVKWHGEDMMTLEKTKIRGEVSEGMICAAEELDLTELFPAATGKSIIDMGDGDDDVGTPLKEVLGLNDTVFHIDNHAITHRADLFSHVGFARELVAVGVAKWREKPEYTAPKFGSEKSLPMQRKAANLMPRYLACVIEIDDLGHTPDWMKERLISVGWRPLNLPVDITNFVATEVGVPLHSFDVDDITGTIEMRTAAAGEKITTLDKEERKLPEGGLVLSDDDGIFDLLGIMGGLRSSTKEGTKKIYLHSCSLEPAAVRKGIIGTGLRTDAATVYEKGVPHSIAEQGFYRALELILELVPGARIVSELESVGDNGTAEPIELSVSRVQSMLGVPVSNKEITTILERLEFTVEGSGETLQVTPPLHRIGDVTGAHDLLEEVGRMYGYNNIPAALPSAPMQLPTRDKRIHEVRDSLEMSGFYELLPLSLVGPELLDKCGFDSSKAVTIDNALGRETSLLAPSTLPALLKHAQENWLHFANTLKTFHVSQVFDTVAGALELGALVTSRHDDDLKNDPFLVLKQDLTQAFHEAGYALSIAPAQQASHMAHPGRVADLVVQETVVGQLFEVHPTVRAQFDSSGRAAAATVLVDQLFALPAIVVTAVPVPAFPAVQYDTTVTMTHDQVVADLLANIRTSSDLLESVEIADIYSGKPLEPGQYNLTLRCTYRAPDRTLKEQETKEAFASVEKLTSQV